MLLELDPPSVIVGMIVLIVIHYIRDTIKVIAMYKMGLLKQKQFLDERDESQKEAFDKAGKAIDSRVTGLRQFEENCYTMKEQLDQRAKDMNKGDDWQG